MLADNMMDIHQARLSIWHTAWLLDQGNRASNESSLLDARVVGGKM
jgi:acyl-CoA dehydrogenase